MILNELAKNDAKWRKMALQICKNKDLADELTQDMYIKLQNNKSKITDGYIFVTLRSLFYDTFKSKEIPFDNFNSFEVADEIYNYEIVDYDYKELTKKLTLREKTIFENSILIGQRKYARKVGIHFQTIHRISKSVRQKLKG